MHPRGAKGGSASKISEIDRAEARFLQMVGETADDGAAALPPGRAVDAAQRGEKGPISQLQTMP